MMSYSVFLDSYKLLLFSWLIVTAFFNREHSERINILLLAGLCIIAVSLLFQAALPVFEPVRFGWQTENAGFVFILILGGGLWFETVKAYADRSVLAENLSPVSYTHLDVYKRQDLDWPALPAPIHQAVSMY